jgi:hypothetical protein
MRKTILSVTLLLLLLAGCSTEIVEESGWDAIGPEDIELLIDSDQDG